LQAAAEPTAQADGGLPQGLRQGIELLSGLDMSGVRVHRNSSKPAALQAHAYAQGQDIHLGPGQEKHLPHEAWHVVQQAQGRVKKTLSHGAIGINDSPHLEREADAMGNQATAQRAIAGQQGAAAPGLIGALQNQGLAERDDVESSDVMQAKGSGGVKIGFDFMGGEDDALQDGIKLVRKCWKAAKLARQQRKLDWMTQNITGAKYKGKGSATTEYAKELDAIEEEKELFLAKLKDYPKLTYDALSGEILYAADDMPDPVVVGNLLAGDVYAEAAQQGEQRKIFEKVGFEGEQTSEGNAKEYVDDAMGAKTRRYAYVEKNYFQMMDFLKSGVMTGRFQQYMAAGGKVSGPAVPSEKVNQEVVSGAKKPTLTNIQIAVAHQELGSNPDQRGVSLSSTEKTGATVGNGGKNFRTADGFRLKIDLGKVPDDVLLMNHYSEKGIISSDMNAAEVKKVTTETSPASKNPYKYGGSVRKNRELYIEHIKPEWVVAIEHHPAGGYGAPSQPVVDMTLTNAFDSQRQLYASYWAAFDEELASRAVANPTTQQQKGIDSAKQVKAGFGAGGLVPGGPVSAEVAHQEVSDGKLKDEFAQWHLGYIRARTGRPIYPDANAYAADLKGGY